MIFKIGTLQFGGNSAYKLESPITGIDSADIRTASGNFSGRDGGYVSSQFYGTRTIVLTGFYIGKDCDEADTLREELGKAVKIRQLLPLYITTFSNRQYLSEVYVVDFKSDITGPTSGRYQVTFLAPDPFLYDAGDGADPYTGYLQALFYKPTSGGYQIPYELPVPWAVGNTATPITNEGSVAVFPEFVLENEYTNPVIQNLTTGKYLQLNITTSPGDRIYINMKNREITLNDVSIAADRTIDSTWFTLEPGINRMALGTDESGDKNWGIIKWRQAYEGI